jgi:predicted nuclease with TOPRIM domain
VVPNTTSLSTEELITENASLRQAINRSSIQLQAHETAYKKQKDTLKNSLIQLKNEINQRQGSKMKDYEFEIERLKSENDKLKIQIGRLKSRWDELKESARKRRTEDDKEEKDP